jgi:hypothetical protein
MQKHLRFAHVALAAIALATALLDPQSLAQTARPHLKSGHQGALAEPLLTGTDGSQTGIAKFQGNLTAISAPSGQALVLTREPDCSLTLFTGTIALTPQFSYSSTGFFADYERSLHTNAGLATTADTSSTCASPTTGFGTRRGVYVGQTTTGLQVFAYVGYNPMLGANALLINSGITNFIWTTLSFSAAGSVTTADLNGDGNGDLVVVNGNTGATPTAQIFVLLGNPDGSFQTAVPYTVPGTASISAVIDDVNGDRKLDIVASSDNGQISVFTGKGDGSFNSAQSFAAPTPVYPGSTLTPSTALTNLITANLRGAGKKDIIASNGLVLLNDGAGNFTATSSAAFPPPLSNSNVGPNLATGDFNKDGKLDLVVSTGGAALTYLGKGDGTFTPGPGYATVNTDGFVTVSDLDGDCNPDIYIGEANGGFYFGDDLNLSYALMGNGDGTFQGAPTIPATYTGTNLGDVNGDGQPDLITPTTGTVNGLPAVFTVQLGTPKGTFNSVSTITLPATITVSVSEFTSPITINTANISASSYALGDLNGDGKADLAFVSNNGGYAVYFVALGNGDGTFSTPVAYGFPQIAPSSGFDISLTADSLHIGDFNHDGHNDLAFTFNEIAGSSSPIATPYNTGYVVLPGVGNGTFGAPIITTTTSTNTPPVFAVPSTIFSTVDVNKDGNSDLLAMTNVGTPATGFGNQLQIYLSKGDGTFQAPITPSTAANPGLINTGTPCTLTDLNKDTKLDLICFGETTAGQAQLAISLGNGDGTFGTATIFNVGGGDAIRSSGLAAADFDGDGNVDLALIDGADFSGIFYGKGDGTFTSIPFNGNAVPKDLINLAGSGSSIAVDLNKDGKPDILSGNTVFLNNYANAPTIVPQSNTTTTVTASATSIARGGSITFTATVTPATGSTIPTGQIIFGDGDLQIGSATVDPTGKATFSTTALASGSHSITAAYGGSTTFLGSLSSTITVNVTGTAAITTTTNLTASATSITTGASITFTATITPAAGSTGTPTGTVTFLDGATTLGSGTVASGKAAYTTTALTTGSHNITAVYSGDTAFSTSTSSAVNVAVTAPAKTTPTVTVSPSSSSITTTQALTVTTTVSGGSGKPTPTGTVTLTSGTYTAAATILSGGNATINVPAGSLATGTDTLTVNYSPDTPSSSTYNSASGTASVTVTAPVAGFTVGGTAVSVSRGATTGNTSTITVTPSGGFTGSVALTAAVTTSPAGANDPPTVSFGSTSPVSITGASAGTATLTVSTTAATTAALAYPERHEARWYSAEGAALACLLLLGIPIPRRRRSWRTLFSLLVFFMILVGGVVACGGSSKSSGGGTTGNPGTTAGTYTVTVTATSGNTTAQTPVTITVI